MKAKKSLGQNFLRDEGVLQQILEEAAVSAEDQVLEIGPGLGALTEKLATRVKRVFAIEIDHRLTTELEKKFSGLDTVSFLEGDILKLNLPALLSANGFTGRRYKVVANIPYYITAPIIRLLLSLPEQPVSITLMVQQEVAERLAAPPGAMSLLSVMAQYYSEVRFCFPVPKEAFDPVPAVESAVVQLIPKRPFNPERDKKIFSTVRAGFAARRKTLANNLASSFQMKKDEIESRLSELGLRKDIRAQALSVPDWERLHERLT